MNDCCPPAPINFLDVHFDQERAEEEAAEYAENGLGERGEKMLSYLDSETPGYRSFLDLGCGSGGLHHELLLRGLAKKGIGVDGSQAFLMVAQKNAQQMGIEDRVEYIHLDFALQAKELEPADLVLMDRVLCCYPDLKGLLEPAIKRSKHFLIISFPRDSVWVRLSYLWKAAKNKLRRSQFRLYYHEPKFIQDIIKHRGMELVDEGVEGHWQIEVYRRILRT